MSGSYLAAAGQRTADVSNTSSGVIQLSSFGARVGPSRFSAGPLQEVMRQPGAHVLAQGVPPMSSLPIVGVKITLADGSVVELDRTEALTSQRYAPFGWNSLRSWLVEHVHEQHAPPAQDWDVGITSGTMYALDAVMRLLIDPGDAVLCEEYTFLATKDLLNVLGAQILPCALDADGLLPSAVEAACEARLLAGQPLPKLLYTIPVGQNPTGSRLHPARYTQIYSLAQRYGFTVVEDDAYYYMQHRAHEPEKPVPGLSGLGPSFLSCDVDGRVVRLDTFSKCLAPGFRLGWVSAPTAFLRKLDGVQYFSSQWGSTFSMMVVAKILHAEGWFLAHITRLQSAMRERCLALLAAAAHHLDGVARWTAPQAGMFLWAELEAAREPSQLVSEMKRIGVAVQPGENCAVAPPPAGHRHIRLTYVIDADEYEPALLKVKELVQLR